MATTTLTDDDVAGGGAIDMKVTDINWGVKVWTSVPAATTGSSIPNAECDAMGSGTTNITYWNLRDLCISKNKKLLTEDVIGTGSVYFIDASWDRNAQIEGKDVVNYKLTMVLTA